MVFCTAHVLSLGLLRSSCTTCCCGFIKLLLLPAFFWLGLLHGHSSSALCLVLFGFAQNCLSGVFLFAMKRLTPDPSVSIADLMEPFDKMFAEEGSFDLYKLLFPPCKSKPKWKSAPDAEWMGQKHISRLLWRLFKIHSNGVMASSKLKSAIHKIQMTKQRLNFSRMGDPDWLNDCDDFIRIMAAHCRDLKKSEDKYIRCMKKASKEEKENLDNALSMLKNLEPTSTSTDDLPEALQDSALQRKSSSQDLRVAGSEATFSFEVRSRVFAQVLSKQSSDPLSPNRGGGQATQALAIADAQPDAAMPSSKVVAECSKSKVAASVAFKRSYEQLALGEDERKELQAWMGCPFEDGSVPQKKRKQKKKSQSSKPRKEEKKPAAKGEGSSGQKKKKQAFYKTTSRHRATSDAWHQAARKARKAGYSAEKVKELAKKASQKVARELDQQ